MYNKMWGKTYLVLLLYSSLALVDSADENLISNLKPRICSGKICIPHNYTKVDFPVPPIVEVGK